jgi:excinuclease UvrABC nuclease subunit
MAQDAATDLSAVAHTRTYLAAFEQARATADNAAALKTAMEARFPNLGMGVALDIGAKVVTGEMAW